MSAKNLTLSKDLPYDLKVRSIEIAGTNITPENSIISVSWTGPWEAPVIANVKFSKIGNEVTAIFEPVLDTHSGDASIGSNIVIPENMRPSNELNASVIPIIDAGVADFGRCLVRNDGTISIFAGAGNDQFTGTGNVGWDTRFSICYNVL
jgi:hypothetical protein